MWNRYALLVLLLLLVAGSHLVIAQMLSPNSGINSTDTYVVFDMTIGGQATFSASTPLFNPITNTSSTTLTSQVKQRVYHVEEGYDQNGQTIINVFLTTPAGGEVQLSKSGIKLFDKNGAPIAIPANSSWPHLPQFLPANPRPISGILFSNINSFATATSASIVNLSSSAATLSHPAQSGSTTQTSYVASGTGWVPNQLTFSRSVNGGTANRVTSFSNVFFHDNSANDAARAAQPNSPPVVPAPSITTPTADALSPQDTSTTVTTGSGSQNVVFQHGLLSSASTWNTMIPWMNLDFSLGTELAPSMPLKGLENLSTQTSELISDIQNQGGSEYILIGHSQGGLISRGAAQYFQTNSPSTVKGVVTIDTPNTGALVAEWTQDQLNGLLQGGLNQLWNDTGCESPLDNFSCLVADLIFTAAPDVVQYAQEQTIGATQDLVPGSHYLTNLNTQPENFVRVGIIGDADNAGPLSGNTWLLERVVADFINGQAGGTPSGPAGGQAFAVYTEIFYGGVLSAEIYYFTQSLWDCSDDNDDDYYDNCDLDLGLMEYYQRILDDLDHYDTLYDNVVEGNDTSDAIVQSASQNYAGATANYPIHGADTHIAATKSLFVRSALDQTLARQFFVPQKSCSYSLSVTNETVDANGTTGTLSVETAAGCAWTLASDVSWITFTPSSGTGPATVTFVVAANTNASRTGTLTLADQTLTLSQAAGIAAWWEAVNYLLQ